ncbi:MAG: NUDIX hydrolase [Geminicoccaceae bacterium]|nr:MAG: NUDIX hydrolase [Geminicoccaceae bacterium]
MRFCVACGGSVSHRQPPGDDHERAVCDACGHIHYINPKVVVGAVCAHGDRILLCRRAIEPRRGFWTIPAGFMEVGETPEEGAIREAVEEAGAVIRIEGLLAVYSIKRIDQVQLLYAASLLRPEVEAGFETAEVALVRWSEIPWHDLAFPTVDWVLREACARGLADPPRVPELVDLASGPRR